MSLITQIKNVNALGRENLNAKGVETDGTETTYEIMSKIAEVEEAKVDTRLKDLIEGTLTELVDDTITQLAHYLSLSYYPSLTKIDLPALTSVVAKGTSTIPTKMVTLNLPNFTDYFSCHNCDKLTTVNAPKVEYIPANCFRGCSALTGDFVFERATSVGNYAFSGSKVTSLDFADTLTSIGTTQGFGNTENLKKIVLRTNSVLKIGNTTFYNSAIANGTGYVYVPDDLVEEYKVAQYWSNYANQIKGLSELSV